MIDMKRALVIVVASGLTLILAACGGRSTPPRATTAAPAADTRLPITPPPMMVTRPTDIPMPPHHTLDLERTVMVGNPSEWLGRASMAAPIEPIGIWDFYRREMPRQGWTEIAASQTPNRVLFYQRGERVAVVEVLPTRNGSRIDIWMNPRSGTPSPTVSAAPESVPQQAPEPPPPDAIEGTPLPPPPWH
jgi:hypothetical protein